MSNISTEGKRWILMSVGLILAFIGGWCIVDVLFVHPKAADYAASLVPGGLLFYPILAVIGCAIAYYGYQMKAEK